MRLHEGAGCLVVAAVVLGSTAGVASEDREAVPPSLRLPVDVRPLHQAVELTLDPDRETSVLWLNATDVKVTTARLGPPDELRPARILSGGDDFVGFAPEAPLARGRARLVASFQGSLSRRQNEGLFAMKEDGRWYAFTQFEPISARRAFPCFDEPSHKIPWEMTLRVPHGILALSNTQALSTSRDGDLDVVRFAPTPPLPSYLVAVAVGPFDVVDVGPAGRNRTPTRLVVPKGRAGDVAWARESTPPLLALLEDYFDRPYPYAKLDQVAIPGVGFAMVHPGLVTYGMGLMVQHEKEESIETRRAWASVCAPEGAPRVLQGARERRPVRGPQAGAAAEHRRVPAGTARRPDRRTLRPRGRPSVLGAVQARRLGECKGGATCMHPRPSVFW